MPRIGFMQGRLSPLVDGRIQAFPWAHWEKEFEQASLLGLGLLEWTLDHERLHENPLMTAEGRARIGKLSAASGVRVESVTGDCFMQAPFFKAAGAERQALLEDLTAVIEASAAIGVRLIVFPLVDNGSVETPAQERELRSGLGQIESRLRAHRIRLVFESDFPPSALAEFIARFPSDIFGVNYDIGNSAALGYDARHEIACYGTRIDHVHVKDRRLRGTTVPLGEGAADFDAVFEGLRECAYAGDFILQTARATDDDHAQVLKGYRDMVERWLELHGFGT
jgi:L-ribulose-5-phosphate 3-epimerase